MCDLSLTLLLEMKFSTAENYDFNFLLHVVQNVNNYHYLFIYSF